QGDQFVGGIGQMRFEPLRTEGILKSLCYHDNDLFEGMRDDATCSPRFSLIAKGSLKNKRL
ncbi:MAG TPA: hypothetical protein VKP65_09990, partial [Rhodothermales bacterium]|nr:hypothetical protein [Rhodothermales bacterium]